MRFTISRKRLKIRKSIGDDARATAATSRFRSPNSKDLPAICSYITGPAGVGHDLLRTIVASAQQTTNIVNNRLTSEETSGFILIMCRGRTNNWAKMMESGRVMRVSFYARPHMGARGLAQSRRES